MPVNRRAVRNVGTLPGGRAPPRLRGPRAWRIEMNERQLPKRGYTYRLSRRQFLVASSAAALAACAPGTGTAPNAQTGAPTAAATAGRPLKIGQLLPFTKVYAELGASMRRATELYAKTAGMRLANRPVSFVWEDDANDTPTAPQKTQKFIDQAQVDHLIGLNPTPQAHGIRNIVDSPQLITLITNAG